MSKTEWKKPEKCIECQYWYWRKQVCPYQECMYEVYDKNPMDDYPQLKDAEFKNGWGR